MTDKRTLHYGSERITYRLTAALHGPQHVRIHVEPDGRVTVSAPPEASEQAVAAAVRKRAAWIWKQLQSRPSTASTLPREWVSGESCRYLGRRYLLKVLRDPQGMEDVRLTGGQLKVWTRSQDPQRVRALMRDWYSARAGEWLRARVAELAEPMPWIRDVPSVSLRRMRSRWGSCSPAGRLSLNPMLIRAPREAVDYVITHELCHLRHHDHSAAFYRLLSRYVPRWKEIKHRLDASADDLFMEAG